MGKIRFNWKKEVEKFHSYYKQPCAEFKEKLIITIPYNPQKTTIKYLCDNKQVNFISETYDVRFYFSKLSIKIYNCSVRFLCIINAL
jgi:hypothetical protein